MTIDVSKLRALAEKAKLPWDWIDCRNDDGVNPAYNSKDVMSVEEDGMGLVAECSAKTDYADFIVEACNAIPKLLDQHQKMVEALQEIVEDQKPYYDNTAYKLARQVLQEIGEK